MLNHFCKGSIERWNPIFLCVIILLCFVACGEKSNTDKQSTEEIVIPKTVEVVTEIDFDQCSGLEKVKFEGNAPASFEYSDSVMGVWEPYYVHFTVYYHEGAEGFTSPEWFGYPTEIW